MTGRCVLGTAGPRAARSRSASIAGVCRAGQRLHAAKPVTSAATMAVSRQREQPVSRSAGATLDSCAAGEPAPSNAPSSASHTSPMSRTRCVRSLCRQRRRSVATRRRETGRQQRPIRFAGQHRGQHVGDLLAGEGALAGQHLVEHGAERPDVAALVDGFAARLFRAHVRSRAEQHAARRHHGG